jgi:hypothetical protein
LPNKIVENEEQKLLFGACAYYILLFHFDFYLRSTLFDGKQFSNWRNFFERNRFVFALNLSLASKYESKSSISNPKNKIIKKQVRKVSVSENGFEKVS